MVVGRDGCRGGVIVEATVFVLVVLCGGSLHGVAAGLPSASNRQSLSFSLFLSLSLSLSLCLSVLPKATHDNFWRSLRVVGAANRKTIYVRPAAASSHPRRAGENKTSFPRGAPMQHLASRRSQRS